MLAQSACFGLARLWGSCADLPYTSMMPEARLIFIVLPILSLGVPKMIYPLGFL